MIVATHSDVLIAGAHPAAVRRLIPDAPGTRVHQLSIDGARKVAVFRRFVERPIGEIFFARLVVFVDGTAERIALPAMLEPLLARDPIGAGVSIVDLESMNSTQLIKVTEACTELGGIPWLVFLDNDADGWRAINGVVGQDGLTLDLNHSQVIVCGEKQLERLLVDAGYEDEIREIANEFSPWGPGPNYGQPRIPASGTPKARQACLDFLVDEKGWAAELVVGRAIAKGKALPASAITLAARIRGLLGIVEPNNPRYRAAAGLAGVAGDEAPA